MKRAPLVLKLGLVFGLILLVGTICIFVTETIPSVTEEGGIKTVTTQICVPNSTACQDSFIKKCKEDGSGWIEHYRYCYKGCRNGSCIECFDECVVEGWKDCRNDSVIECGDWNNDGCLEYKVVKFCEYGCLLGECKLEPTAQPRKCKGTALCLNGTVVKIVDGDTLEVGDYTVRLALINTPERGQAGYFEAKSFVANLCKVGSVAIVDQDDLQPFDIYDRLIGVVYCQGKNLNAELLHNNLAIIDTKYCAKSEFSDEEWAKLYGC